MKFTRTISMLTLVLAMGVMMMSCEGPAGPAGTNGTDGLKGKDANIVCGVCHADERLLRRPEFRPASQTAGRHERSGEAAGEPVGGGDPRWENGLSGLFWQALHRPIESCAQRRGRQQDAVSRRIHFKTRHNPWRDATG